MSWTLCPFPVTGHGTKSGSRRVDNLGRGVQVHHSRLENIEGLAADDRLAMPPLPSPVYEGVFLLVAEGELARRRRAFVNVVR
jgi:hypothetical protein